MVALMASVAAIDVTAQAAEEDLDAKYATER